MTEAYTDEQVQEILAEATTIQKDSQISQQELQEIATEIGISAQVLERAKKAWLEKQKASQKRAKRRNAFVRFHLIPYLAVSIFLVLLNLSVTPRYFWSVYPVLGWGLGVAIDGSATCDRSSGKIIEEKENV